MLLWLVLELLLVEVRVRVRVRGEERERNEVVDGRLGVKASVLVLSTIRGQAGTPPVSRLLAIVRATLTPIPSSQSCYDEALAASDGVTRSREQCLVLGLAHSQQQFRRALCYSRADS